MSFCMCFPSLVSSPRVKLLSCSTLKTHKKNEPIRSSATNLNIQQKSHINESSQQWSNAIRTRKSIKNQIVQVLLSSLSSLSVKHPEKSGCSKCLNALATWVAKLQDTGHAAASIYGTYGTFRLRLPEVPNHWPYLDSYHDHIMIYLLVLNVGN